MRSDSPAGGIDLDFVAELRAIVEETCKAIEASQAILDRCAAHRPMLKTSERTEPARCGGVEDPLGEIGEGLIHAYNFAKHDGDVTTVTLIEKALFHVGRRLALSMSATQAGIVCH